MMLFYSMSPLLSSTSAHLGHGSSDDAHSTGQTWGLNGSEDTGWVTLETTGASPSNNLPGYANWELNFPPGAIISNVNLEVGADGSNGIHAMNPNLYSPSTQYSFFDWEDNGGFGYQEGFLDGYIHNERMQPNSDLGAMYKIPSGAEVTDLVLEALRPVDPAVSLSPYDFEITDWEIDSNDGRLYVAIGSLVLQLDDSVEPKIIHLRDLGQDNLITDLYVDDLGQRLIISAGGRINVYSLSNGELIAELPNEPIIANEEAKGFIHSFATSSDIYGISERGLFRLNSVGNSWNMEQVAGNSNWPEGVPMDVEDANGILYVSIENSGIARWDTTSNSVQTILQNSGEDDVHEMITSGNVLYIATENQGVLRWNFAQNSWISSWSNTNWLENNNVKDLVVLDNNIFILLEDTLHQYDTSIGVMINQFDVNSDLNMIRTGKNIIPWSANGIRAPANSVALLHDGSGVMSVLDPSITGLYSHKMDLVSSPSGTDMNSVTQIGEKIFVSSNDIIDIFDTSIWKWLEPVDISTVGNEIVSMITDENQYLYVATADSVGLQEINTDGNFSRFWGQSDFNNEEIIDLSYDSLTSSVIASHGNSVTIVNLVSNNAEFIEFNFESEISDIVAYDGILYMGTDEDGVQRFNISSKIILSSWRSTGVDDLEDIPVVVGNGLIYVGIPGFGVTIFDETTGEILEIWEGGQAGELADDSIRSLHIDGDGYIWIGTDDGATRFNGQRFNDLQHDGQWWSHRFYGFDSDSDYVWSAMANNEICRWDRQTLAGGDDQNCWGENDGLPSDGPTGWQDYTSVRFVSQNQLMVTTFNGAALFDTNSLSVVEEWVSDFSTSDSPIVQHNGIVYLGLKGDGILRYDLNSNSWLQNWNSANNMIPNNEVTALVLEQGTGSNLDKLWVGGDDGFDLTQIDLSSGTVSGSVEYGTQGLEELPPQKLIVSDDILYFIPELSDDGDNIGRIDLSSFVQNPSGGGFSYLSVSEGAINPSNEFGEDIFIHGADIVDNILHIGASEAETRWWQSYDEGYIMRYNITGDSWDSAILPGQEVGRTNAVYLNNRLYVTYGDSVKELDSGGNMINSWPDSLDGPIREIVEYNGEILFATQSGIARYDPVSELWLETWTKNNDGLHPNSNDDEILELFIEGNNLWYSSGITNGQWWNSNPTVQRVTGTDNNGDGIIDGNDHDIWDDTNSELPPGDIWSMELCGGVMHFGVRWSGQFGAGGGVGRFDTSIDTWDSPWENNNDLEDDDATALTCDDQNVMYIGYQDEGHGISRFDYSSGNWLYTLEESDGISEESVWWDSMEWGDGFLVIGHSYEDGGNGGMSVIEVSGNIVSSGTILDQSIETSSINYIDNSAFGDGFIIGRPGGDQGYSSVDWLEIVSNNLQLNKGYFDSQSDFLNGIIEEFTGNSENLYIVTASDRFDNLGNSILEGQYGTNGEITWTRTWNFGFDTIRDLLFVEGNIPGTGNMLWITTQDQGLWRLDLDNNNFSRISASLSPDMDGLSLEDNLLAIGLTSAGKSVPGINVLDITTLQWEHGELLPGLPSNYVLDAVKHQGKTWFATANGVGIWNDTNAQWEPSLGVSNGLPTPVIEKLYIHTNGEIWMGTPVGVVRYDPLIGSYYPTIDRLNGLIGNRVNDIYEDNGKIFLSHNGAGPTRPGVSSYNLSTNIVESIYKLDQVPSNTITAISADSWGVHIATDQEPLVHYNFANNQFEDGAQSWQIGNWPVIEMKSDGKDLFALLDGDLVRIDAQGITHSVRNTWFLDNENLEPLELSKMSLGPNGLFLVGSDGMYGWGLPNYAPMDQLIVRFASPLSLNVAGLNLDITNKTHPGEQIILASTSLNPIIIENWGSLQYENNMPYSEVSMALSSPIQYSPTWLKSINMRYKGEWNLSETNDNIAYELQRVLDLSTMTASGMEIELRLKTTLNGSMKVRLTYDWERIQSPVEIINVEDRPDDGGGVLTVEWTASPDPDFKEYSIYIHERVGNFEEYLLNENPSADAISSVWGQTKIDVGTTGGKNEGSLIVDGVEYYATVVVTYSDDSLGEPSNTFGPVITDDDIPEPPTSGFAEPNDNENSKDGELFVEWTKCRSLDISHTRIYIYTQSITNALALTDYIDIDDNLGNSTILELDAGIPYWLALTCVDNSAQEDLINALIIGPVIPTGGLNDGFPPPKILGVNAYDTPDDEGGRITVEWIPSIADDCGFVTIYALDAEDWLEWDIDPNTGQNIVVDEPITANSFRIAEIITDCSVKETVISSIDGASLIDGKKYYFAVVASDKWLNEDKLNVDVVSAEPFKQLDAGAAPPDRINFIESWDEPDDDGSAIRVAWKPSNADDFAFYVIWANNQPINNLDQLWTSIGDDRTSCGCMSFNQQYIGNSEDNIEIILDKARYGENSNLLDSNSKQNEIKPNELLYITVTVHDIKGNVWLNDLLQVDVIPINNIDDKTPPKKITDLDVIDWPNDDGTAVGINFEKSPESDVEQYAIYASTSSFDSVSFGDKPVLFADRNPDLPIKINSLSDGTAVIAEMEVFVSVIPIDSAGNSITNGLIVDSSLSKDNRGEDPGGYLPDIENVRANWILDGNAIQIQWNDLTDTELTYVEIYVSNSQWENTDDATLIAKVEIKDEIFIMNRFNGDSIDKFSDWYIGVSASDEITHKHIVQVNHVNPYGTDANGNGEGTSTNFLQNLGSEVMISIGLIFAILIVAILIVRGRKPKGDNWQFEGTWGIQKERENELWEKNVASQESIPVPIQQPTSDLTQQPAPALTQQPAPALTQQRTQTTQIQNNESLNQLVSDLNEKPVNSDIDTSFLDDLL